MVKQGAGVAPFDSIRPSVHPEAVRRHWTPAGVNMTVVSTAKPLQTQKSTRIYDVTEQMPFYTKTATRQGFSHAIRVGDQC